MPSRPPYPEAYRTELVRLVREEGRTPNELAKEFEPTAQSITNWVGQAEVDAGNRDGDTPRDCPQQAHGVVLSVVSRSRAIVGFPRCSSAV